MLSCYLYFWSTFILYIFLRSALCVYAVLLSLFSALGLGLKRSETKMNVVIYQSLFTIMSLRFLLHACEYHIITQDTFENQESAVRNFLKLITWPSQNCDERCNPVFSSFISWGKCRLQHWRNNWTKKALMNYPQKLIWVHFLWPHSRDVFLIILAITKAIITWVLCMTRALEYL